jgi:protocatechuate 3,4-dioxygenase, beta subunit
MRVQQRGSVLNMTHRSHLQPLAQPLTRRQTLLGLSGAAALGLGALPAPAQAQTASQAPSQTPAPKPTLHLTPSQTEGPYYPVFPPADNDNDLLVNGTLKTATSQPVRLTGTVRDTTGKPIAGGVVEIWQCDGQGRYHHPRDGDRADPNFQGFGRCPTDAEGTYQFVTMRPALYSGRTPHIHVKVKIGDRTRLTTQLYVAGDPGNERDSLWRSLRTDADRQALTSAFVVQPDGWLQARFDIVLAA